MNIFLERLKDEISYQGLTQKELAETILNVAAGNIGYDGLLQWLLDYQG